MKKLFLVFVKLVYQNSLGLALPRACRYSPSCSDYCCEAIEKYGVFRGLLKAGLRILRCHPFSKGGYDPI